MGSKTEWFSNARFGMFVHWGLYSIPAGFWENRIMGRNWYAEWIQAQGNWPHGIPGEAYRALADQFKAEGFDADVWADLACQTGMKYFLITSKHHDGFALWDSKASDFNVVQKASCSRDILGELHRAMTKRGLHVGYYYSHWQDWEHAGGGRPPWPSQAGEPEVEQPDQMAFQEYWDEKCLPQVRELTRDYGAEFFWFDSWEASPLLTEERIDSLIRAVREINPDCLINSRIGTTWNHPEGDAVVDYLSMGDNKFPSYLIDTPWETSATFNRSWGYHREDHKWRSSGEIIRYLVDNCSRNGNFQLNIGPKGDGSIPKASIRRMKEVGAWLDINGEAVYGTDPYYGLEPDWGRITVKPVPDSKDSYVYLHIYDGARKGISIDELTQDIVEALVLETGEHLSYRNYGESAYVYLPEFIPDERVSVLRLKVRGELTACKRPRALFVEDKDSSSVDWS